MSQPPRDDLVHAPLAHWARCRAQAVAIDDGDTALSFAALHEAVQQARAQLEASQAPATVFVDERASVIAQLTQFLAIVASGRCAAVGDPEWSEAVRSAARSRLATQPAACAPPQPDTPFYIGYTSGSTGAPKGFRRDHRSWTESFRACEAAFGPEVASRILAPGRPSHSLFLFGMLLGLWRGGGVVVQERFSAARALETLGRGHTPCLVAAPSQLIVMMELAGRRALAPLHEVRLIMISGARWMRERTPQLRSLFPQARVIEFYGASETSFVSWMDADESAPADVVGRPFANVELQIRDAPAPDGAGLIFVRSPMLFTDYVGGADDATAAVRDGPWLSVRDMGRIDAQGRLRLAGRQNRMIVTQGKNVFPEEPESVLAVHPEVAGASVHGVADALRGQQLVAIVCGAAASASELAAWCRERMAPYKTPRRFFACDDWPLTVSGKTDHARLAQALKRQLEPGGEAPGDALPCLRPLR